jgi:hypothetical protein
MTEENANVLNLSMEVTEISETDSDDAHVCFTWKITSKVIERLNRLGRIASEERIAVSTSEFLMIPDDVPLEAFNPKVTIDENGVVSVETSRRVKRMWPVTVTNRMPFTIDALAYCFEKAFEERGLTHINASKEALILSTEIPFIFVYNNSEVADKLSLFHILPDLWEPQASPEENLARFRTDSGERFHPKLFSPAEDV